MELAGCDGIDSRISVAPESEVNEMRGWYTVNTRWSVAVVESGLGSGC